MKRLRSNRTVRSFSKRNKPACVVDDGDRIVIETKDAFSNLVRSVRTLFEDLSMDKVNPATGPIAVTGLRRGQTLIVSIDGIRCGRRGVIMCSPELGQLGREVRRSRTKIIEIKDGRARFSEDLWIDLNPHVGVIGVAPADGDVPTFYPGDHGGNMDTVDVRAGAKVYLPAFVDGGMLAIGDVHAAMGDGEVCGTGIEVPAEVTAKLSVSEELVLQRPMIETPTEWVAFAAAKTLDEAARKATHDLVRFISNARGVDFEEGYMLASVAANLRISQVVDPLMAARMSISKRYL
ncbi:MAG: acetamidase/formamidase family protein [Thermoplasmata archaeon]